MPIYIYIYIYIYRLNTKMRLRMLCLSGFELYSRWVPLRVVKVKIKSPFKNVSFMRGGY